MEENEASITHFHNLKNVNLINKSIQELRTRNMEKLCEIPKGNYQLSFFIGLIFTTTFFHMENLMRPKKFLFQFVVQKLL